MDDTTTKLLTDFQAPTGAASDDGTALQSDVSVPLEMLGREITARIDAGDKNAERASQNYKSAGLHLIEVKGRVPDF
jgi:hypothetical protein